MWFAGNTTKDGTRLGLTLWCACILLWATGPWAPCLAAKCLANEAKSDCPHWVATWGTAMTATTAPNAPDLTCQSLRLIVHTSIGGKHVRIWLSNRFGTEPLTIGAAHIAVSTEANPSGDVDMSAIEPGSDRELSFNGRTAVRIPPGATVASDAATLDVPALSNIAVSLYFPENTIASIVHGDAIQASFAASGDAVGAPTLNGKSWTKESWYVLSGVDVDAPGGGTVVVFGDSITDGYHSSMNANHRWPDYLAIRLASSKATTDAGGLGVVNAGISGNRVLLDGNGPNAMARFEWDVLERSGVRYLILFHGINDIEATTGNHQPYGDLEKRLEWALTQMATRAHEHGILVFGATQMTDCRNLQCAHREGEAVRTALNQWIRSADVFDGVIDFDHVTRDPQHPTQMADAFNSGDYVHPNDAGYQAMANAIDLSLFTKSGAGH